MSEPGSAAGGRPDFGGLRVCAFESRKGSELESLLARHGAHVTIAPSMREIPLEQNVEALAFADELRAGRVDMVVFLTGVGARALQDTLAARMPADEFCAALRNCTVIVRGPKPAVVLRGWQVKFEQVAEPNTWRELLALLDARFPVAGKTVAVQEYGKPNPELYAGLEARGARTVAVPVYRWGLPEDCGPLRQAVQATIDGDFDVLMFTSANQLLNVLTVAEEAGLRDAWLAAAARCVIASIGPTATETIVASGLPVDVEPEHPKMGHLVRETAIQAGLLLAAKRSPPKG